MDETPVLTSSLIVGAVGAIIAIAVAFGLHITDDQKSAILTAIPVFWLLIAALAGLIKPRVTSNPQASRDRSAVWAMAHGARPGVLGGTVRGAAVPPMPTLAQVRDFQRRQEESNLAA